MKGLIIDEPWISMVLDGLKTWEMRSKATSTRGAIALIRKGSGSVVGVATLTGCSGPLDIGGLEASAERHRVPLELFRSGKAAKWNVAWCFEAPRRLKVPVRYRHPSGAVTWVRLDPDTSAAVLAQVNGRSYTAPHRPPPTHSRRINELSHNEHSSTRVPIASDGSWFGPHLLRAGLYTIGGKGDETRLDTFDEAIAALARMDVPKWRRPNAKGNWGIVTGIRWELLKNLRK